MQKCLDFEKPILEIQEKINRLLLEGTLASKLNAEKLEKKCDELKKDIFSKLSVWQKVLLARHPLRPYSLDYINLITDKFIEMHGDRCYGDDGAIVAGISKIDGKSFMIIGEQKGRNIEDNMKRNFGMPHPEGYRKSLRLMKLAEKFNIPIVTFIDTPGAYPGLGAEERGQAEAIAHNLREMVMLKVPIISIVIGEGGSGGALAIGVADTLAMLEYTIYSVISPEGCASILWKDVNCANLAASALKLLPENLLDLGVIDKIIKEPIGGAHFNIELMSKTIKKFILEEACKLESVSIKELLDNRILKYKNMGNFFN